jgi:uncharacterized protein YraI
MRTFKIVILLGSVSLLLACNLPMFAPATQSPLPTSASASVIPLNTPITVLPTLTTVPTITPTATIVPTPSVPQVSPISAGVNCRSGPDVSFPSVSSIALGSFAQIAGRNSDSSWWYVRDPYSPGSFCWVSADVVTTAGNLAGIPVMAPTAGIVTKVTASADVASPVFCGGPNVINFSGQITTNGPAKVSVQWELTGDKSFTTSPETVNFKAAGTKSAPDEGAYKTDCGHFTITLHVLSPNDVSASKNFKVEP